MSRPTSHARARVFASLALVFAAGCGDDDLIGSRDAGPDAAPDSVTDAAPDSASDVGADVAPDVAPDAAPDSLPETVADAAPDAVADIGPDTAPDIVPDATPEDTVTTPDVKPDPTCLPAACDAAPPALGETSDWRHGVASPLVTLAGDARHRGRDLYLREGDAQWALAKFAYGPIDKDLVDEDVDIWLARDCGASWELLGTATTTNDGDHAAVEGIEDSGGRVYFEIPADKALGLGRHRLLFVVRGDHSTAEQFIEVLPGDARFVVTDVDGTQTESETAEFTAVFLGTDPAAQPHGAEAMTAFAARGYRIFYLTARPDWLHARTHAWLRAHGYPPGLVHTTLTFTGQFGGAAETFKTDELSALVARFPGAIAFGVGNTASDEAAYANIGLPGERAILYQFDPTSNGTRVDDYATLVTLANAQPLLCK